MKNIIHISVGFMLLCLASCSSCNRVEPNHEGVLMTNYGKEKSDFKAVTGGQGILGIGSELYMVPMYEQKGDVASMPVTAKGGGVFTVDPTYTYQAMRGHAVEIIFNYRQFGGTDSLLESIERNILNTLVLNAYKEKARELPTDTILYKLNDYERSVETRLKEDFAAKHFQLLTLTSGLLPPPSMIKAIEARNNASIEAQTVQNQMQTARFQLQKDSIERMSNSVVSMGLTREILQARFIDAIRVTKNHVIITDGKTPVMINN